MHRGGSGGVRAGGNPARGRAVRPRACQLSALRRAGLLRARPAQARARRRPSTGSAPFLATSLYTHVLDNKCSLSHKPCIGLVQMLCREHDRACRQQCTHCCLMSWPVAETEYVLCRTSRLRACAS